jgi:phospholipid/cholesterol/gamma-HCH transport system ATP-binding protein
VRGIRKSFKGVEVLRGIDLEVAAGEIFVMMGPSGSGKTVLLRQIIGAGQPDAGEVLVDGKPVHEPGLAGVRMGMVFQSAALLNSLTVSENVGLYLEEHRVHPPACHRADRGGETGVGGVEGGGDKMPSELSGGMKKRVAIARALVMEPQLLLYDEPTSELDPLRSVTIGREILALNRRLGVTSIVVTHDRDLACGVANRVAFMSDGLVRFVGTPAELRSTTDPLVRDFLTIDFDEPEHVGDPMRNSLETRLGIFFAMAFIAGLVLLELAGGFDFFRKGVEIKARFNAVNELQVGAPVKLAGVPVGEVRRIAIEGNKVVVTCGCAPTPR